MNCPKCNAAMEKVTFEGVEVDRCTRCGGLWFDFQEQQQLKPLKGAAAIDTSDGRTLIVQRHAVDRWEPRVEEEEDEPSEDQFPHSNGQG